MNILFITLSPVQKINEHGIYSDLLREFIKNGHCVNIVTPCFGEKTMAVTEDEVKIIKVNIGSVFNTNIIKKGINTVLIGHRYKKAVKEYLFNSKFDFVLYPTPPVTIANVVKYIKKRDQAKTYLLLKDIFPQNAVDLGMIQKKGFSGLVYWYFRRKEKKLYAVSDKIGCMSKANVDFIIKNNPEVCCSKVEICPNTIEPQDVALSDAEKIKMREKYGIPKDKKVFIYGGNLGKPQGVPFIIDCLNAEKNNSEIFFLIVGEGTEFWRLKEFVDNEKPINVKLMRLLPRDDYDRMVASCDVGMIFLDNSFSIPNFPSRILSYMQAGLPVLACTDPNTDIGRVILDGGFGWWCESNDVSLFSDLVNKIVKTDLQDYKHRSYEYLIQNYSAKIAYNIILNSIEKE